MAYGGCAVRRCPALRAPCGAVSGTRYVSMRGLMVRREAVSSATGYVRSAVPQAVWPTVAMAYGAL
eukprot:5337376-Prymnesium_polylepis.1